MNLLTEWRLSSLIHNAECKRICEQKHSMQLRSQKHHAHSPHKATTHTHFLTPDCRARWPLSPHSHAINPTAC